MEIVKKNARISCLLGKIRGKKFFKKMASQNKNYYCEMEEAKKNYRVKCKKKKNIYKSVVLGGK